MQASPERWNVDSADMRAVHVTMRTLLLEEMLRPLAGPNDALASYGIESFARLLAERLGAP